jgi:uncharacterized protein YggE
VIVVVGEGTQAVAPDRCLLAFSVYALRDTAGEAIGAMGELVRAAIARLHEAGVPETDVRTRNISLQDWLDEPSRGRRPVARVATSAMTVANRTLEEAGALISALTETAGDGLRLDGIHLSVAESDAALAAARQDAVVDARTRAEQLAGAAGVRLGSILSIEEGGGPGRWMGYAASAVRLARAGPPVPIEPGEQQAAVRVTVTFEIDDA